MVRPNELSFARRGALNKLAARSQGARPSQITAVLVGVDPEDDSRAIVSFDGSEVSVLAGPVKMIPGALCAVEVDSANAPVRVLGPVTTRPEGLDEDVPTPDAVMPMPELGPRELTEAEAQAIQDTADNLAQAQEDLADAFERIGDLANEVGFAWSGQSDETDASPPGTNFRVDWTALGGGEFRLEMKNIPTGANYAWDVQPPGESSIFIPGVNPVVVTVTEPGSMWVYAWADDENIAAEFYLEVHPAMLGETGPLQAAIAEASAAAVRASRIAPRSLHEPTIEDGENRPTGSVWTLVNAEGEELAYWAWDGTEWVPQALSTQVIPYLDAAHISTGVLDADRINVTEIWGQIATFGKIITEHMIATGAVTAEALNVVYTDPESGYGFSLQPEGLTILDESGSPVIALRADMANYFTIMRDGAVVASISPHGDIASRSVSAAEGLRYRGTELATLFEERPRGVIAIAHNGGSGTTFVGTSESRLIAVSLNVPRGNRAIRISYEGRVAPGQERHVIFSLRQSASDILNPNNGLVWDWESHTPGVNDVSFSRTTTTQELGWPESGPINVALFVQSRNSSIITFYTDQRLIVEDLGPAVEVQSHSPWVPSGGGGTPRGTPNVPLPRSRELRTGSSWVQSYRPDGTKYVFASSGPDWAQRRAYQGYHVAASGVIGFPSMVAELSGATIRHVRLWITNTATALPEGATARISLHGYTSRPATHSWSTDVPIMEVPFARGESQAIDIPAQYHAGVQSGLYRGIVLSASELGTQYAGVWDGAGALWEIIYEQ